MATPSINPAYLDEFTSRFEKLSGKIYRCSGRSQANELIKQIISERSGGKCYYTKEVLELIGGEDPEAFSSSSSMLDTIAWGEMYDPQNNEDGLDIIKQADVGITTADFAVAETGCLVEIAYKESTRLLSSLSRVHIVLLRATNILGNMRELSTLLMEEVLSKDDKPTITLISGPSRTSDIEMKSVLGVHGPHEVHAILLLLE